MPKSTNNYQTLSTELDAILQTLQAPELDIDAALELYQRGQKIVKELERYLQTAENTVRKMSSEREAGE